jgi:CheY-like chemotaxis protein
VTNLRSSWNDVAFTPLSPIPGLGLESQLDTILVVEDETFINMYVSEELEGAGYTVLTAGNADQAIALLETHDVRFIFTDIDMPGSMDGLKLAAAVRHRWPPIDIIVTTGKSRPEPREMPPRSVFLPKPYRAEAVIEAVRRF